MNSLSKEPVKVNLSPTGEGGSSVKRTYSNKRLEAEKSKREEAPTSITVPTKINDNLYVLPPDRSGHVKSLNYVFPVDFSF